MLNPLMTRPRVVIPDRPALTKSQKARIWSRENGLCRLCGKPVPPEGDGVQYDHLEPREISADDTEANLYAVHTRCHARKTGEQDAPRIAKVRRMERLTKAKVKSKRPFPKRADPWGYRP